MRRRLLALGFLVAVMVVSFASPSSAVDLPDPMGCKPEAPSPHSPSEGIAGFAGVKPSPVPPPEDPFAPGAKTSVYEQYGGAGLWWPTYDLGCMHGTTTGMVGEVWTGLGNFFMSFSEFEVAVTGSLRQVAWSEDWIKGVDNAGVQVTSRLGPWFTTMMGLGLVGVGLVIIGKAHRADYSDTTRSVGWAMLMLTLGTLALGYPAWAATEFDNITVGGTRMVADAIAGQTGADTVAPANRDAAIGHIHDDAMYRLWLRGMFGDDKTKTATDFGPRFYKAMALSWSEQDTVARGGDDAKGVIDRKHDEFSKAAEDLKDADPVAYRHMQGLDGADTRAVLGVISVVMAAIMCFFLAVAALLVFIDRIIGRVFIMALPVVTPLAANRRMAGPMRKLWKLVEMTFVNLLVFTVAGGVFASISSGVLASTMPLPVSSGILLAGTLVAWHATKPVRSLAHIAGVGALAGAAGGFVGSAIQGAHRGVGSASDSMGADPTATASDVPTHPDDDWSPGTPETPVPDTEPTPGTPPDDPTVTPPTPTPDTPAPTPGVDPSAPPTATTDTPPPATPPPAAPVTPPPVAPDIPSSQPGVQAPEGVPVAGDDMPASTTRPPRPTPEGPPPASTPVPPPPGQDSSPAPDLPDPTWGSDDSV